MSSDWEPGHDAALSPATPDQGTASGDAPAEFHLPHPAVRTVWMLSATFTAAALGVAGLLLEAVWLQRATSWPLPFGVLTIAVFLLFLVSGLLGADLRYRAWQYALRHTVVLAHFGVIWRTRRCVPRSRIQHVDIESGPIDRAFGLVKLSIFTAGTIAAVVVIPGLSPTDAELLRERLVGAERDHA